MDYSIQLSGMDAQKAQKELEKTEETEEEGTYQLFLVFKTNKSLFCKRALDSFSFSWRCGFLNKCCSISSWTPAVSSCAAEHWRGLASKEQLITASIRKKTCAYIWNFHGLACLTVDSLGCARMRHVCCFMHLATNQRKQWIFLHNTLSRFSATSL